MDARTIVEGLLATQPLAVLSTCGESGPYASLIAIGHDGAAVVYFATSRSTRKWANLTLEPRVSLMLDDRSNRPEDFHQAVGATAVGVASACEGEAADNARDALLRAHPHLAGFTEAPSAVLVAVRVHDWYVVSRFQSVDRFCPKGDS